MKTYRSFHHNIFYKKYLFVSTKHNEKLGNSICKYKTTIITPRINEMRQRILLLDKIFLGMNINVYNYQVIKKNYKNNLNIKNDLNRKTLKDISITILLKFYFNKNLSIYFSLFKTAEEYKKVFKREKPIFFKVTKQNTNILTFTIYTDKLFFLKKNDILYENIKFSIFFFTKIFRYSFFDFIEKNQIRESVYYDL